MYKHLNQNGLSAPKVTGAQVLFPLLVSHPSSVALICLAQDSIPASMEEDGGRRARLCPSRA